MDTLLNMKAFLATARTGGFSAAARQIGVAPSVVTKRVSQLEWQAKAKLLYRSTRSVTLTEAGERFLPTVRSLIAELDQALAGITDSAKGLVGHIRLTAPTTITVMHLGRLLSAFQQRNSQGSMEVILIDRPVDPIEEGFDIAIGALPASYGGVIDEPLCPYPFIACASPAYLKQRGIPRHPRDLSVHDCLVFSPAGVTWSFVSPRGPITVNVHPKFRTNESQVLLDAAREGNGIAVLETYIAMPAVKTGELVPVLENFPVPESWLKALIPETRTKLPRIQALLAWLKDGLKLAPFPSREQIILGAGRRKQDMFALNFNEYSPEKSPSIAADSSESEKGYPMALQREAFK